MPNWCLNNLYLTGPAEEIDRLLATVRNGESAMDFEKFIPMPPMLDVGDEVKAQLALAVAKGNISEWL
jgi:hypothetical protein